MERERWTPPRVESTNAPPSVIVFLPHASAGVSIRRILYKIASPQYTIVDLDLHTWTAGRPDEARRILQRIATGQHFADHPEENNASGTTCVSAPADQAWILAGRRYLYITSNPERIGQAINDSGLQPETLRYLVCLRDPRDALVSLYYLVQDNTHLSIVRDTSLHAHYCAIKDDAAQVSLDQYVRQNVDSLHKPLSAIQQFVEKLPRELVRHASYAALCQAFPTYLASLIEFLDLTLDAKTIAEVLRSEDIEQTATLNRNTLALCAKASPKPGRHKRDLQPATVQLLNGKFKTILDWIAANDLPQFQELYQ